MTRGIGHGGYGFGFEVIIAQGWWIAKGLRVVAAGCPGGERLRGLMLHHLVDGSSGGERRQQVLAAAIRSSSGDVRRFWGLTIMRHYNTMHAESKAPLVARNR